MELNQKQAETLKSAVYVKCASSNGQQVAIKRWNKVIGYNSYKREEYRVPYFLQEQITNRLKEKSENRRKVAVVLNTCLSYIGFNLKIKDYICLNGFKPSNRINNKD